MEKFRWGKIRAFVVTIELRWILRQAGKADIAGGAPRLASCGGIR
jgi:hypothetical protein